MKQPSFWKEVSLYNFLLFPFSIIYQLISCIKNAVSRPYKPSKPVICIGNVTVGGAGKTPTAIAIAKIITDMGKKPVFLTRGYGGSLRVTTIVNPDIHKAKDTGDEPILLSRVATTIVSKNRVTGAKLACEKDFDVIIMDDGLQNPTIEKTISLLVIDGSYGIGSGYIIPAGPLRESLKSGLSKVEAVVFIGDDKKYILSKLEDKKIIKAKIKAKKHDKKTDKYVAFCGLGNPDKFFNTLVENGYNVREKKEFPDHYNYKQQDIDDLKNLAKSWNAKLITTEKDYVRLSNVHKKDIETLPISIEFEKEQEIRKIVESIF